MRIHPVSFPRAFVVPSALCLICCVACTEVRAQSTTDLPGVTVTAPYTTRHGGYLVSGNFKVDPRLPEVVMPARPLVKDDILSVQPLHLNDNEYLVLQECAVANCSRARLVRVWGHDGALTPVKNNDDRIWITHGNKYFLWLDRLPEIPVADCAACGTHFARFKLISPPLTLVPAGRLAAYHQTELRDFKGNHPVPASSYKHDGASFVVTFASGSIVRIKRMHAER